jgi:hypothetical protein
MVVAIVVVVAPLENSFFKKNWDSGVLGFVPSHLSLV